MNEREFAELAAGHALGALSEADTRRFEEALRAHPTWQAIVDDDLDTAAALADGLAPVAPPAALRADLLSQITALPQGATAVPEKVGSEASPRTEHAVADDKAPERAAWSRRFFALAAGFALIVGVGITAMVVTSQLQRPAAVVALDEIRSAPDSEQAVVELDSGVTATAHWSGELDKAVLVASGLDQLGAEETYELWFVRGDQAIPAGLFESDGHETTALLDAPMQAGDVIAVTIEQAGGSASGAPTTDPIIVIPTT